MLVFVLVNKDKEILGVVQDQALAERWYDAQANNDYITFELDNLNLTGLEVTPLKPEPPNEMHSKIQQGLADAREVQQQFEALKEMLRKKQSAGHLHKIKPKGERYFCSVCKDEFQPCVCMKDGQPAQHCKQCTGLGWRKKANLLKVV